MSSTDSWLLFLNLAFLVLRAPWNSLSQIFGGEATWMASFGGRIVSAPHVSHTFPRFLEGKSSDTWRDAHAFFLLWNMSWQMNLIFKILWSLQSLERWIFQVIKSDSFAGTSSSHHLGFGARLGPWWASTSPHRCSSAEPHEPHELGLFTTFPQFPQSKCATKVFLSEVTPPVHSFAVISLPLQLTTKSGTLRVIWETLRRPQANLQQAVISAECNFEKRFKKAPKPSSFSVFWERLFCVLL